MVDQLKGMFGGGSDDDAKKPAPEKQPETELKGMFGGGSSSNGDKKADDGHNDFVKRYTTGDPNEGYSEDEAKQQFQKVLKTASPDQIQAALKKTVENLPENQRAELGQMIKDRQQGKNLVQIQRTGSGTATAETQAGSGDLDDVLGGLLGGLLGGSSGGSSGGGGGGLGDILGGLLGGSDSGDAKATPQSGATTNSASGGGSGGGIGDLLGGLLSGPQGKAIMGGIAAFAMQAMQGGKDDKK